MRVDKHSDTSSEIPRSRNESARRHSCSSRRCTATRGSRRSRTGASWEAKGEVFSVTSDWAEYVLHVNVRGGDADNALVPIQDQRACWKSARCEEGELVEQARWNGCILLRDDILALGGVMAAVQCNHKDAFDFTQLYNKTLLPCLPSPLAAAAGANKRRQLTAQISRLLKNNFPPRDFFHPRQLKQLKFDL
jgi:hypothetical protein